MEGVTDGIRQDTGLQAIIFVGLKATAYSDTYPWFRPMEGEVGWA